MYFLINQLVFIVSIFIVRHTSIITESKIMKQYFCVFSENLRMHVNDNFSFVSTCQLKTGFRYVLLHAAIHSASVQLYDFHLDCLEYKITFPRILGKDSENSSFYKNINLLDNMTIMGQIGYAMNVMAFNGTFGIWSRIRENAFDLQRQFYHVK